MTKHVDIYKSEQGDPISITGRCYNDTSDSCLTWVLEADSTIEIKVPNTCAVVLTLTGTCDFTVCGAVFQWTPTDTHINTLTVGTKYDAFVHARNNATPRERVLKFTVKVLNT
jgi:hypothetical protein